MPDCFEASGDRSAHHENIRTRSSANLKAAQRLAAKNKDYNSEQTRERLSNIFTERFGQTPYSWQLDVTEALLLGLDTVVIAGTGAGKTMPFMMPLLLHPEKLVIILSPLKVLQRDQVCKGTFINAIVPL